jgi:hypothetical protein
MSELTGPVNSHIRSEPIEAPEPQPVRRTDQVRFRALIHGWNVLTAEGPALATFASFKAGVEAYELYRSVHDRRGRS